MADTYVNDSGTWRKAQAVYVRDGATWRAIKNIYVNQGGTWRLVFGGSSGTVSWTTAQTTTWTVPDGVYSISVNACGGGGGGGQADGGANFQGYGGAGGGANLRGAQVFTVYPGQVLNITVGAGGAYGQHPNQNPGGQSIVTNANGLPVSYVADGGSGGQSYVPGSGISAWAGAGVYGANYPTSTTSRTFSPGVSFNGGSSGGRGGDGGNYKLGLPGEAGKVFITY